MLITNGSSTQSKSIFGTASRTTPSLVSDFGTSRTNALSDSVNATKATSTMSIIADGAEWTNASSSQSTTQAGLGTIDADKDNTLTLTGTNSTLTHNGLTWTLKTMGEGSNTYQILEATDVATVRGYNTSETKAVVKYLDGKTPVNPSTAKRMTMISNIK